MSSSVYFVFGWWNSITVLLFKKLYCCVCLNVDMCECLNVWGVKHLIILILILFLPNIFQNFWAKTAVKPAKNSRKLVETANNSNIIGKKQRQNRIKISTILSPSDMFSFCSFYSAMISIYFTPSLWIFPVSHAPLSCASVQRRLHVWQIRFQMLPSMTDVSQFVQQKIVKSSLLIL